jgi:RimJ/RimL family protein N-acetyltransferase
MRFVPIYEGQAELAQICATKCECPPFAEPNSSIGIWDSEEKKLVGGVTYSCYTVREIWASIWLDDKRALTRPVLRELFSYPFITCKVVRLTTNARLGNEKSVRLTERLGFTNEGKVRRFFGDEDEDAAIIFGMLKEECRWIKHG